VYYPYFLHFDWLKFVFLSFLFIAITGYFVRGRKKRPYLLVGWFWFVIILIPVIGIIQVGEQAMADRYTYISQTGLTIAFIWTLGDIREHINLPKIIGILSASVLIAVLSCISYVQTSYWKDGVALFGHALNVTRPNPSVHYHLAVALSNQGSFSESAYHYAESIRMRPNFADAHFGLGYVLAQQGRMGEALEEYRFALMLAPRNSFVYSNMGLVLLSIGKKEEALDCFSKALEMNPHDELARYNLVRLKGQLKMLPP